MAAEGDGTPRGLGVSMGTGIGYDVHRARAAYGVLTPNDVVRIRR